MTTEIEVRYDLDQFVLEVHLEGVFVASYPATFGLEGLQFWLMGTFDIEYNRAAGLLIDAIPWDEAKRIQADWQRLRQELMT